MKSGFCLRVKLTLLINSKKSLNGTSDVYSEESSELNVTARSDFSSFSFENNTGSLISLVSANTQEKEAQHDDQAQIRREGGKAKS